MPIFYRDKESFEKLQRMVLNGEEYEFTPCIYCGLPASDREHVIAQAKAALIYELGLARPHQFLVVPSCKECNHLAGKRPFTTVSEKRAFLHKVLRKRYRKYLNMPVWTEEKFKDMSASLIGMIRRAMAIKEITRRRLLWPSQNP